MDKIKKLRRAQNTTLERITRMETQLAESKEELGETKKSVADIWAAQKALGDEVLRLKEATKRRWTRKDWLSMVGGVIGVVSLAVTILRAVYHV